MEEMIGKGLVGLGAFLIAMLVCSPLIYASKKRDKLREKTKEEEAAKLKRARTILPGDTIKTYKGIPIIKSENGVIIEENSFSNLLEAEKWINSQIEK